MAFEWLKKKKDNSETQESLSFLRDSYLKDQIRQEKERINNEYQKDIENPKDEEERRKREIRINEKKGIEIEQRRDEEKRKEEESQRLSEEYHRRAIDEAKIEDLGYRRYSPSKSGSETRKNSQEYEKLKKIIREENEQKKEREKQRRKEEEKRVEEDIKKKKLEEQSVQVNLMLLEEIAEKSRILNLLPPDLNYIKIAIDQKNYIKAIDNSKKLIEQFETEIKNYIPVISLNLKNPNFKVGSGKKNQVEIKNIGKTSAKNISFEISNHQMWDVQKVAVKVLSKIDSLKPQGTDFIDIWIKSDLEGEIPIEFVLKYTDGLNREYNEKKEIWINASEIDAFNNLKEKPIISSKNELSFKETQSIAPSSYLSLDRTIYEPVKQDFIISSQRPLPNVKNWIEKNDSSMYWLIICINNNSDKSIDEWEVELETPTTLKILDARIEGTEHAFNMKESFSKAWLTNWILGVPHHLGVVIPRKGSKRIYFKLGSDACGVSYSIKGKVSTSDCEIPIKEKHFKYSCDTATLKVAIRTNPEEAEKYAETVLSNSYNKDTALKLLHSFRIVQEIDRCCARGNYGEIKGKLQLLLGALEGAKAGERLIRMTRDNLESVSIMGEADASAQRAGRLCGNLVDAWINEVLRM